MTLAQYLSMMRKKAREEDKELDRIGKIIDRLLEGRIREKLAEDHLKGDMKKGLAITYFMRQAYTSGFRLFIVVGNLGAGKSVYTMLAAMEFLSSIYRKRIGWRDIIDKYMVFKVEELVGKATSVNWRNPWPCLVWDDAGVYGSAYLFFVSKFMTMAVGGFVQTIRSRVRNILMSTPAPELVLKVFRLIPERIIVVVRQRGTWESEARGYIINYHAKGETVVRVFTDYFNKRMPDRDYEYYMNKRDSYIDEATKMYNEFIRIANLTMQYRKLMMQKRIKKLEKEIEQEMQEEEEEQGDIEPILLPPK